MKVNILKNKSIKTLIDFIARLSISSIFIYSIPGKITDFAKTVDYISSRGIPYPISVILLIGAIICLIFGSGFFIFGENQRIGAIFLLIFLIPTTLIFHIYPLHEKAVLMNLGLIGGLLITTIREQKK